MLSYRIARDISHNNNIKLFPCHLQKQNKQFAMLISRIDYAAMVRSLEACDVSLVSMMSENMKNEGSIPILDVVDCKFL
jgi:hypothetical protein